MDSLKKIGNKGWAVLDVVGRQSNKLANKLGAEAFWPMTLDKESEKAAAILRTFTRDGFRVQSKELDRAGNRTKSLVKIPPQVFQQAKGLAIFTVFRTGLHLSGAGGSGILIARKADGSWGPPSGILLHTLGVGLMLGIDIYDTVLVLRTQEAVNAFTSYKVSIGAEISAAAGPLGSGGALDMGFRDKSPAWVYSKSKGFYAGVAIDGTVVVQRKDENERFYGRKVAAAELIQGLVHRPSSTDGLVAMIEAAEGKQGAREDLIPQGSPPSEASADMEPPRTDIYANAAASGPSSSPAPPLRRPTSYGSPSPPSTNLSQKGVTSSPSLRRMPPPFPRNISPPEASTPASAVPLDSQQPSPFTDAPPGYADSDVARADDWASDEKRHWS